MLALGNWTYRPLAFFATDSQMSADSVRKYSCKFVNLWPTFKITHRLSQSQPERSAHLLLLIIRLRQFLLSLLNFAGWACLLQSQ
jgi:hypothetical protein